MKKLAVIALVAVVMGLAGCVTTTPEIPGTTMTSVIQTSQVVTSTLVPSVSVTVPSSSSTMYPDDLVITPGGYAYRGNVQEQGKVNPWPSVTVAQTSISAGTVSYRDEITTNAGQVRNDIVTVASGTFQTGQHTLELYAAPPAGFTLTRGDGAGLPGTMSVVLRIDVASGVAAGDYAFSIGVVVDGVLGGVVPVTVHVVTQTVNTATAPVSN
jgi:hypothetical protein